MVGGAVPRLCCCCSRRRRTVAVIGRSTSLLLLLLLASSGQERGLGGLARVAADATIPAVAAAAALSSAARQVGALAKGVTATMQDVVAPLLSKANHADDAPYASFGAPGILGPQWSKRALPALPRVGPPTPAEIQAAAVRGAPLPLSFSATLYYPSVRGTQLSAAAWAGPVPPGRAGLRHAVHAPGRVNVGVICVACGTRNQEVSPAKMLSSSSFSSFSPAPAAGPPPAGNTVVIIRAPIAQSTPRLMSAPRPPCPSLFSRWTRARLMLPRCNLLPSSHSSIIATSDTAKGPG